MCDLRLWPRASAALHCWVQRRLQARRQDGGTRRRPSEAAIAQELAARPGSGGGQHAASSFRVRGGRDGAACCGWGGSGPGMAGRRPAAGSRHSRCTARRQRLPTPAGWGCSGGEQPARRGRGGESQASAAGCAAKACAQREMQCMHSACTAQSPQRPMACAMAPMHELRCDVPGGSCITQRSNSTGRSTPT